MMLTQVESKIHELNEEQRREYKKRKQAYLEELGIQSEGKNKSTPVITDEEYEALLQASFGTGTAGINKTARMMNICTGLTLALGIVAGIATAVFSQSLGFVYFSVIVFVAFLVAMIFKGIGESIRLQQQIIDMKLIDTKKESKPFVRERRSFPEAQPMVEQQFANAPPVQQARSVFVVNEQ